MPQAPTPAPGPRGTARPLPGSSPRGAVSVARTATEPWLTLGCGVAAAVPIVVVALHAVTVGWMPLGDRGWFAVQGFDVLSGRSPLLGPWSSGATVAAGRTTYSPGPMLYWLLAVPARFLDPRFLPSAAGAVNVLSVLGVLVLARRSRRRSARHRDRGRHPPDAGLAPGRDLE